MKKARILSSESDASIKIKQQQDTNIDLSIAPPAQSVNFQPSPMAELATMEPPATRKPSTFNPIIQEEPIMYRTGRENPVYIHSPLVHPGLLRRQTSASKAMDGQSKPRSEQVTVKASQSQTDAVISRDIEETPKETPVEPPKNENANKKKDNKPQKRSVEKPPAFEQPRSFQYGPLPTLKRSPPPAPIILMKRKEVIDESVLNGPYIEPRQIIDEPSDEEIPIQTNDNPIIDELKRPMEVLAKAPSADIEQKRLRDILEEKTKKASVLEAMLEIYKGKHQIVNGLLTCRYKQLESLVKAYTNATAVDLMIEDEGGCGCSASAPKIIDIESILVTVNGKSFDFRFGFNDAYADMVRHGINLKQVIV